MKQNKPLDIVRVTNKLKTRVIGCKVHYYPVIDSTSTRAMVLAEKNAPEGTLVIADYQTSGRGREHRKWISPPNQNLLFSFILRPTENLYGIPQITTMVAVAVCESIRKETRLPAVIKWPNDIRIKDRKIAGILTEMKSKKSKSGYIIVGIGINVNTSKNDFPEDLKNLVTTLSDELRRSITREKLLLSLLEFIDIWYLESKEHRLEKIISHWKEESDMPGRLVRVHNRSRNIEGYVTNIDSDGGLLIRQQNGITHKIHSGEIEILN